MEKTNPSTVILLIDDDATTNFLHKRAIRKVVANAEVHQALDGQFGYEFLQQAYQTGNAAPAFIFVDINMPRLDGWGFLEAYRSLPQQWREQSKLFMLTTSINPDDHERASDYTEVNGVVDKILSSERFQELIGEA